MNPSPRKTAVPQLLHRADFEAILRNYQISPRAQRLLKELRLVLINGLSGSGRNTVIAEMLHFGGYRFIVSDTTRPPRYNNGVLEQSGGPYWFRTEEEILHDLQQGEFLEAEIIHDQQVSGMSIRELEKAHNEGKIAITEVEIGGLKNVAHAKPDTLAIIMLPPSYDEWRRRLSDRGEMSVAELKNRMETATTILTEAIAADYATLIVNETVKQTATEVDRLAHGAVQAPVAQQEARDLAAELLQKTQALLQTL